MDCSLSSVPPVWPRPRPEIIGTASPHAAAIGASISETLSPTPPVECLSATGLSPPHFRTSPESRMASVSATVSLRDIPRRKVAMAKAAACPSETSSLVSPLTKAEISSRESSDPSRLRLTISCGIIAPSVAGRGTRGWLAAQHRDDVVEEAGRAEAECRGHDPVRPHDRFAKAQIEIGLGDRPNPPGGLEADALTGITDRAEHDIGRLQRRIDGNLAGG